MNPLREIAKRHKIAKNGAAISHYIDAYWQNFRDYRESARNILEIGVGEGGSLTTWKEFFPNAKIYGIDIKMECKRCEEDRIKILIGNQQHVKFLHTVVETIAGPIDIIIDDGGHKQKQQRTSFTTLFRSLAPGGVYVIEDLQGSYWPKFDGGLTRPETTINMLKSMVDSLHYRWFKTKGGHKWANQSEAFCSNDDVTYIDRQLDSMHFYDGLCFIYKKLKIDTTLLKDSDV
jgi:8-demethyl-8-alpha-L-rhamnosyltetracenomycin-C 2'-O-methyltransferase